jgi:hypothetical protein
LVGENGSSCQVTYIPGAIGTGTHQVSAAFPGDTSRDASNGSTDLGVTKHPSATSISCAPESIALGAGTSTCAVTVTDTSSGPSTPTGSVALSSASGAFGSGCEELALVSTSQALCTVTYTPSGTGMNLLTADYGGDPTHATSEGTAAVNVAAPPSAAGPSSSPALKKKCRKKKRSASAAKKKKCKKKKRR